MRLKILWLAALCVLGLAVPSAASAAGTCTVPGSTDPDFVGAADIQDSFSPSLAKSFVELPVTVPAGTKAIRVRYCYENSGTNTVDIGAFEPGAGAFPAVAQRRGWSGSAVKDLAISENGFSPANVYGTTNATRKAYVSGYTTRAYQPGPIPAGTWNFELGLAALDATDTDGIFVHVVVETSNNASIWANAPYVKTPYSGASQNPNAGWYTGDLHVHGEQEPGNTPVAETLNNAFGPLSSGGAGLDFLTLIDHNNDVGLQGEAGKYESAHPGHLIVPGTEVTTYNGHFNNQAEHAFADYRMGAIYRYDGAGPVLTQVRGTATPAGSLATASDSGGWSQINHPTTFPEDVFGPLCRGCAWTFSDADTNFADVDAIEVQNTAASLFTGSAIAFYQRALATGAHVAAVGSSDYHKTGDPLSIAGAQATAVYANSLSEDAITAGVKADHTYVKFHGVDGPDIRFTGDINPATTDVAGQHDAIVGDSVSGPALDLSATVLGAGPSATRPGPYQLLIQRDGQTIDTSTVSGDSYDHNLTVTDTGRYQVVVIRPTDDPAAPNYEVYSSPIWFTRVAPSNAFKVGKLTRNAKKGTATLKVSAGVVGKFQLKGNKVKTSKGAAPGVPALGSPLKLKIAPKSKLAKQLRKKGKAKTSVKVTFTPSFGTARSKTVKITLKRKLPKHRKH